MGRLARPCLLVGLSEGDLGRPCAEADAHRLAHRGYEVDQVLLALHVGDLKVGRHMVAHVAVAPEFLRFFPLPASLPDVCEGGHALVVLLFGHWVGGHFAFRFLVEGWSLSASVGDSTP